MTADGSEDALIKPERLPTYVVPPTSILKALKQIPIVEVVEGKDELDEEEEHSLSDNDDVEDSDIEIDGKEEGNTEERQLAFLIL